MLFEALAIIFLSTFLFFVSFAYFVVSPFSFDGITFFFCLLFMSVGKIGDGFFFLLVVLILFSDMTCVSDPFDFF